MLIMTEHFQKQRAERYAYIVTTVGLGKVVHRHKQAFNKWGTEPCIVELTDTGVAIVKTEDSKIVTMYLVGRAEARSYFTDGIVPMVLWAIINRNIRKGYIERQNAGEVQMTSPFARARSNGHMTG